MNDLAEKALHGLDVTVRQVRNRPMSVFALLGFAAAIDVVLAGGHVGAAGTTRALTTWLGIEDAYGVDPLDPAPGALMFGGVVVLVALWIAVVTYVRRTRVPTARLWGVAAAWAAPFALGPPLLDTSVYSYTAYGMLQRAGHDPYVATPQQLNHADVLVAIDPAGRTLPSSAGPLGTLIQHLAVSIGNGSALASVIVLRVLGVLAAVWIARLAADMGGARRASALAMTALNPLLLLYIASGAHLDGVLVALALTAVTLADQRRWVAAVIAASLAGSVLPVGLLVVVVVIVAHALGRRAMPTTTLLWRVVGRDLLVAAATLAVLAFAVSDGWGWLGTVRRQFVGHTPFAISSAIGQLLTPIVRGASFDDLQAGGRITALAAAVFAVATVLVTARTRALERTAGYVLLTAALLAPVLHPWYLLWGTLCLAPTVHGGRRVVVLTLTAMACLIEPPGFSTTATHLISATVVLAGGVVLAVLAWRSRPREGDASPREADDARAPRRDRRDVARLRAFRRAGG